MSAGVLGFAVGDVVETKTFGYRYRVWHEYQTRDGERLVVCRPVDPDLIQFHQERPFFFPPEALVRVEEDAP